MEKQRVEALSDAILAIIVTIMALELQLPEELTVVGLRSMLPMLFIYITSFLQIMAVWLYYHELYKLVDHCLSPVLPHRSCPLGCSLDNHDSNGDQDESKTVIS